MKIKKIKAFEVLDSRGTPTIAAFIELKDGTREFGFVPSGASTGSREAIEKRDNGKNFNGKGVEKVIKFAEENLFPELSDPVRNHNSRDSTQKMRELKFENQEIFQG